MLFDLGPHVIDQSIELFGLPEAISANCEIWREGPNTRYQLHGDQGSLIKMGLDPQENQLKSGLTPSHPEWAKEVSNEFGKLYTADSNTTLSTPAGHYEIYFIQMAEAILRKGEAPFSAESALWNIRLIELAIESEKTGQQIEVKK